MYVTEVISLFVELFANIAQVRVLVNKYHLRTITHVVLGGLTLRVDM